MHYLIDGHNLIGKMPDIDLNDPNDEVKLVLRLRSWAAGGRKRRVTVIFDSGLPGGRSKDLSSGNVKVIFAPAQQTADELLINRLQRVKNPAEYRLISSDQRVIDAATQRRVPHWRSEKFVARMLGERMSTPTEDDSPATAADPRISEQEVAEFLELFGPVPEQPPQPPPERKRPPKKKRPRRRKSFDEAKTGDDPLQEDEIDEWLRLFRDGDDAA